MRHFYRWFHKKFTTKSNIKLRCVDILGPTLTSHFILSMYRTTSLKKQFQHFIINIKLNSTKPKWQLCLTSLPAHAWHAHLSPPHVCREKHGPTTSTPKSPTLSELQWQPLVWEFPLQRQESELGSKRCSKRLMRGVGRLLCKGLRLMWRIFTRPFRSMTSTLRLALRSSSYLCFMFLVMILCM